MAHQPQITAAAPKSGKTWKGIDARHFTTDSLSCLSCVSLLLPRSPHPPPRPMTGCLFSKPGRLFEGDMYSPATVGRNNSNFPTNGVFPPSPPLLQLPNKARD